MELTPLPDETFDQLKEAWEATSKIKDEKEREASREDVKVVWDKLLEKGYETTEKSRDAITALASDILGYVPNLAGVATMSVIPRYKKLIGKDELATAANPVDFRPGMGFREAEEKVGGPINPLTEPSLADITFLQRLGVKPGGSLDITARGAATFAADTLKSPFLLSQLLKSATKNAPVAIKPALQTGEKLLNVPATADVIPKLAETFAKIPYKTNFKSADVATKANGKRLYSDIAYKYGIKNSAEDAVVQADNVLSNLGKRTDAALNRGIEKIAAQGRQGEFKIPLAKLYDKSNIFEEAMTAGMSKLENFALAGKQVEEKLAAGLFDINKAVPFPGSLDRLGLRELQNLKTQAQKLAAVNKGYEKFPPLPVSATGAEFGVDALASQMLGKAYKKIAANADKAIEDMLNKIERGLGAHYDDLNQDMSSLLIGRPKVLAAAESQAKASVGRQMIPPLAGALAGGAAASVPAMMGVAGNPSSWIPFALGSAAGAAGGAMLTRPSIATNLGYYGRKVGPAFWSGVRAGAEERFDPEMRKRTPNEQFIYEVGGGEIPKSEGRSPQSVSVATPKTFKIPVRIDFPDHTSFTDTFEGTNEADALDKAQRMFPDGNAKLLKGQKK